MRDKRPRIKALAVKAKQYVLEKLKNARMIELRNIKRGKYFRIVADVYIDNVCLGNGLIDTGLAYFSGINETIQKNG